MAEITEKRFPRIVFTDSQDNSEISGGSSDFSTAKVTVTISYTNNPFPCPICTLYEEDAESYMIVYGELFDDEELNVPLYKGKAIFCPNSNLEEWGTIVCTGGVEYSNEDGFVITGDGTITATESDGGTT